MFYRYIKNGGRIPVDFDGTYQGGTCFLVGGAPILMEEPSLYKLLSPGATVVAMNNAASLLPAAVDIWIGGDKPMCYCPRILLDPKIQHFGVISRRDFHVRGTELPWKHCPNTYFFGTNDKFTLGDLLKSHRDLAWWKNTFYMALQLIYRMGFRKVYTIGCQFKMENDYQYSYGAKLDPGEVEWNQKTYHTVVANMKHLKQHFEDYKFEVISSTPDSALNEFYPYVPFEDAVKDVLKDFPEEYDTNNCPHSSVFKKEAEKEKG